MLRSLREVFSFPNPVNEVAARVVAGIVVIISLAYVATGESWILLVLAYGFLARVASGPTLSPAGILATRVLAPRLGKPKLVPGPPKRFAQFVGLVFTILALVSHFALDAVVVAKASIAILTLFASLESFAGFCAGCYVFNLLMRWGLIPESVCRECVFEPQAIIE